ncbi:MAG: DUF4293 domain-containing protein [Bacteroidota bacterium]
MIQRIQTIYLLFALIMMVLPFFIPYVEVMGQDGQTYHLMGQGIYTEDGQLLEYTYPTLIILAVSAIFSLVIIFLYKKRLLQLRLSVINLFLMLGSVVLMAYYLFQFHQNEPGLIRYDFGFIFPVIAFILTILAFRAIKKDEILIRSAERIR